MPHLSLSLLGSIQVTLEERPVTGFKSDKVRALLFYLVVEAKRPHRRESLAGMLWPGMPDRSARSNLRDILANLRKVIDDRDATHPFLLITRGTIQFNQESDHRLDVTAFSNLVAADQHEDAARPQLEEAVALYGGAFLEGFSLTDSPAFEEWALFARERLARQATAALHRLSIIYEQRGEYEQVQSYAWKQLELEPWDEVAHRQLMRAMALNGQRSAALAQYQTCRRLLAEELAVEPAAETTHLYKQIRDGELQAPVPLPVGPSVMVTEQPSFLNKEESIEVESSLFVAREHELMQLDSFLDQALTGRGRVVFITGEAGSGKTALIQEFAQRAQDAHSELVVASGNCNAYTGIGDPYLPFREILELLTGDVQARWAAGAMTKEHAQRLWNARPHTAQALIGAGPDLIDTFVPRLALLERVMTGSQWPGQTEWTSRLDELVPRRPITVSSAPGLQQGNLFKQYTSVLQVLAQRTPLLLVLDDLQWADLGSISLLFHLGRHLVGGSILIVGAYRPEEVALGGKHPSTSSGQSARHPLQPVVNEFQRDFGDIIVDLSQTEGQHFVNAFLDSEPNLLGAAFREMIYRQTRGHPLFTVELLRGLQERGDLVQDSDGRWVEGSTLDWKTLPARVEAAIRERIGRLDQPLQAALRVASVEGEVFTAEVVARIQGTDTREMLSRLSGELDRGHRLVRAQAIERLGGQRISRYRFRNYLFQKYLYDDLDQIEQVYLHEDVGNVLEELYGDQANAIAPQLAWHFQEAGIAEKAIRYLHQAGDRAVQLSAYQEGRVHLNQALDLLLQKPDAPERAQQELEIQLSLGLAWMTHIPGPDRTNAYARARELCQQTGKTSQLSRIMSEISISHFVRAEYQLAHEYAQEALSLAQQAGDPLLVALGHWHLGFVSFGLGEYVTSRVHLEKIISFYDPRQHHQAFVFLRGSDAGVSALAYDVCCLWCLGYPEQALQSSQRALALARDLDHPFSLADVLCYAGCMFNSMRQDAMALKESAEELTRLAEEISIPGWLAPGIRHQGEAAALLGQTQEGIAQMHKGIEYDKSRNVLLSLPGTLGSMAMAQAKIGKLGEALTCLGEAFVLMEQTGESHWEAELYRKRAELLLRQGDEIEAKTNLCKAIEVARRQQAKSWELRATVGLARLWQKQGKTAEARQMLEEIYSWFTEGFDTPDLQDAKALLEELARS